MLPDNFSDPEGQKDQEARRKRGDIVREIHEMLLSWPKQPANASGSSTGAGQIRRGGWVRKALPGLKT
ncbi:hypothetical protein [Amaricoccus tamworthensis]|uniref:hypothetical protein n=1 Tax=Amaricoccus tamworthensis TaxID=57002 RepID=UPI003C7CF6D4